MVILISIGYILSFVYQPLESSLQEVTNRPSPRYAEAGLKHEATTQTLNPGVWMFSASLDFVGTLRRGDAR